MRKRTAMMLGSVVLLTVAGCTFLANSLRNVPVAGSLFASLALSEKDESALGQSVALQVCSRYPLVVDDPELTRYVTRVGRVVAASSEKPGWKFYFGVLRSEEPNAFSGPHGYVFITTGALKRMHNESELAGVLGHEIGHVCKHHGLNAMKTALLAKAAAETTQYNRKSAQFSFAADFVAKVAVDDFYSQAQEVEADEAGTAYMIDAGYDPNAYVDFLRRLKKEQKPGIKIFTNHPALEVRIQKVNARIVKLSPNGGGEVVEERFKTTVTIR